MPSARAAAIFGYVAVPPEFFDTISSMRSDSSSARSAASSNGPRAKMKRISGGKRTSPRGIDRTGDVIVLRRGCEGTDLKPTETEEYARRRFAERAGCSYRIGNVDPTVAGLFRPSRAPEGAQRYSGLPASRNSVAGNIRCIGMRRIDDRFDSLGDQPLREAVHAAKSADAGCEWQRLGVDRAASQREDRVEAPVASEVVASDQPRQFRRLRRTPRMRTRMCSAPSSSNLIASGNCTPGRWLSIVGIGEDGVAGLSDAAKRIIANAELVVGGARHLALATELLRGETLTSSSPMAPALDTIVPAARLGSDGAGDGRPVSLRRREATRRTRIRGRDLMPAAAVRVLVGGVAARLAAYSTARW